MQSEISTERLEEIVIDDYRPRNEALAMWKGESIIKREVVAMAAEILASRRAATSDGDVAKVVERLLLYADDPMWADHAEVPKSLCSTAADLIVSLQSRLAEETAIVDRVWAALGVSTYADAGGKEISELVREWRERAEAAEARIAKK